MKKTIFYIIMSAFIFSVLSGNVSALNVVNDGDISLEVDSKLLENVKELDSNNTSYLLGMTRQKIATTYIIDQNGKVIKTYSKNLTSEDAEIFENNPESCILEDGKIHESIDECNNYSNNVRAVTGVKELGMSYQYTNGTYWIHLQNHWLNYNPNVKSYDVIALRWENYQSTSYDAYGHQIAYGDSTTYSNGGTNMKKGNYGVGISMNLFDNYQPYYEEIYASSTTSFGTTVYGTYQHATTSITLNTSKSYSFGAGQLGNTIVHSYPNYFDNMSGTYRNLSY